MGTIDENEYEFTEEEITLVRRRFPKLALIGPSVWEGVVDVNATYNEHHIQDIFQVIIGVSPNYPNEIPVLFVDKERLEAIAKKHSLNDKRDLHYNPTNGISCLCAKQEEKSKFPPGSTIADFVDNLVIPYLYGLSFYDSNGRWPWGEYSHGGLGLLEYYVLNRIDLTKEDILIVAGILGKDDRWAMFSKLLLKPSPSRSCPCGSSKGIEKCHEDAWVGASHLLNEMKRLKLNPYKIFRRP